MVTWSSRAFLPKYLSFRVKTAWSLLHDFRTHGPPEKGMLVFISFARLGLADAFSFGKAAFSKIPW